MGTDGTGTLGEVGTRNGHVAMGDYLAQVLRYTYDLGDQFPQNRIIVPADLVEARYDFIDTMPKGGKEALRQALKNQFGLVVRREMRPNLVLTVKNPAAGLHKHTDDVGSRTNRSINITMMQVANQFSKLLGVEVTDQTGLAGGFDFTLTPRSPAVEDIKTAALDQLGLELIPAADNQQVEFLVVEKAKD
jgi:uncharacterized protein (TIGR03435 family)